MFRRSASLAIPHRLPNAPLAHESQRQIAIRIAARNCPRLGTFKTNSLLPTRRNGGRKMGLCFAGFVLLTFRGPLASHDSNPYPNRSRIARYNATKFLLVWLNYFPRNLKRYLYSFLRGYTLPAQNGLNNYRVVC